MTQKIRILIIGGDGMLGHQLWKEFSGLTMFETRVTLRNDFSRYLGYQIFDVSRSYPNVDVLSLDRLLEVFTDFRPQVVINAVGIVKQRAISKDAIISLEINSLLPHRLALLCDGFGARLIHPSTDCVFSGRRGMYRELDEPDALDLYGRTKFLGEVTQPNVLTLRTSIIGLELDRKTSMLEWFLNAPSPVKGFAKALYNGLTTLELSRLIRRLILDFPDLSGLYQVSSQPISKYDLLKIIKTCFAKDTVIEPDESFVIDRTLDSTRFHQATGYVAPSWHDMIQSIAESIGEVKL
jgi:dTDP-4-dehydrorhamnose reductase